MSPKMNQASPSFFTALVYRTKIAFSLCLRKGFSEQCGKLAGESLKVSYVLSGKQIELEAFRKGRPLYFCR
jgi:hypothetical protein